MSATDYASKEILLLKKQRIETALLSNDLTINYWERVRDSSKYPTSGAVAQYTNELQKANLIKRHLEEQLALAIEALGSLHPVVAKPTAMETRRTALDRMLAEKGWSVLEWATNANVTHHTAKDYYDGKRRSYPNTKMKLAKALGIPPDQLPE